MIRGTLLAVLSLMMVFEPAEAQTNRETLPPGQARVLVESYARCVVRFQAVRVRAALQAYFAAGESDLPVDRDCVGNAAYSTAEMSFTSEANRYALAEALYAADYGKRPAIAFDAVPMERPPEIGEIDPAKLPSDARRAQAIRESHDRAVVTRYLLIVGDCVARTAPDATKSLVMSGVETRAEAAALATIQPTLAECLPKGQTVRFNRTSLRGILALSAYRLSDAVARGAKQTGLLQVPASRLAER